MPELPEVETVVRGLRLSLPGRTVAEVRFGKTDFVDNPGEIADRLPGMRISDVTRLGKFISIGLEASAQRDAQMAPSSRFCLIIHLGMTGQLTVIHSRETVAPHTHVFFDLDDGRELRYTDPRRFGHMLLIRRNRGARGVHRAAGKRAAGNQRGGVLPLFWIAARTREGVAARSECSTRYRQHLCRREPVTRAPAPCAHCRNSHQATASAAPSESPTSSGGGDSFSRLLRFPITSIPRASEANFSSATASTSAMGNRAFVIKAIIQAA